MLALSTAWNVKRYESGKSLVEEIIDLGLSAIELNVEITEKMLDEILILCKKGKIKIVSLHNCCPKLTNVPSGRSLMGAYLLSSADGEERKKAVELTKRAVKFAHLLNAQAVIVHPGEVTIESHTKEILIIVLWERELSVSNYYQRYSGKERKRRLFTFQMH